MNLLTNTCLIIIVIMIICDVGWAGDVGSPQKTQQTDFVQKLSKIKLQKLLKQLEINLGDTRTIYTEFRQDKHLSLFTNIIQAKGICMFQAPDSVRFELTSPFKSAMIANGKSVAQYEFVSDRWRKLKLQNETMVLIITGQIGSWLRGKILDQSNVYEISAVIGQRHTVTLTPQAKQLRQHITRIELVLTRKLDGIESVTIREPEGDFTVLRFENEIRNRPFPAETFATKGDKPSPLPKFNKIRTTPPTKQPATQPTR